MELYHLFRVFLPTYISLSYAQVQKFVSTVSWNSIKLSVKFNHHHALDPITLSKNELI